MKRRILRDPNGYAAPASARSLRKWEAIIAAFMEGRVDELCAIQRAGARGRIFARLIVETWKVIGVSYRTEPVFEHRDPNPWYVAFAADNGIKLRMHAFYNPDFVLDDGTWVEATLSENTAYAKLFRHGHQAPRLMVVWLDEDAGFHKTVCAGVPFPNAEVVNVATLYPRVRACEGGEELIAKLELLKALKGVLL